MLRVIERTLTLFPIKGCFFSPRPKAKLSVSFFGRKKEQKTFFLIKPRFFLSFPFLSIIEKQSFSMMDYPNLRFGKSFRKKVGNGDRKKHPPYLASRRERGTGTAWTRSGIRTGRFYKLGTREVVKSI
jgi:hypothetical protein